MTRWNGNKQNVFFLEPIWPTSHQSMVIQWKPLIMIILGPALFDNNNRLITLSGRSKNLHYLTQFIVTTFYMYKKQQNLLKKTDVLSVVCLHLVVPK
jgi:hypothetical protein